MPVAHVAPPELASRVSLALNSVLDPCSEAAGLPAGLVDMGLVRSVDFDGEGDGRERVSVVISLTHPSCLMAPVFVEGVERQVAAVPGVSSVSVSLDSGFHWTEEAMTDEYRSRLRDHRARLGREPRSSEAPSLKLTRRTPTRRQTRGEARSGA